MYIHVSKCKNDKIKLEKKKKIIVLLRVMEWVFFGLNYGRYYGIDYVFTS
jgi:hypothetical protein